MATDTVVNSLIINKLTKALYDAIADPSDTELYLVPDEIDSAPTSGSNNPVKSGGVYTALGNKQDTLISGTNIKTINNQSLLGEGNISISGGSGGGGDVNIIEVVKVNGTALTPDENKAVDVSVPTKVSDLTNDSGFITDSGVVKTTGDQTIAGTKTFSAEVRMTAGGTSDITSGVLCSFKTNRAQITNFATHNILTGGTNSTTPITFYKYGSVSSQAPASLTQLAKIDTDGNIYEGTTKLSDKYLTSHQDISGKQDLLVSGSNIKTINNESILGSGNITIQGGSSGDENVIEVVKVNGSALTPDSNKAVDVTVPTESTVSGWGFTKNSGTITGVTGSDGLTGSGTSGAVTIKHAEPTVSPAKGTSAVYPVTIDKYGHILTSGTAVTIPTQVTELTVSGWGFTKNTGTYSKPSGGIPATDLASDVLTSLGLADTALQSFTETDPTVPSWAKQSTKPTYTASEVGALPDTTSIPTESTVSGWGFTKNAGTITGVTGSNGLTGSGTSGSVTISHAAPSTSPAKTTLAVYPIKIDQYGHITAAGSAVTIPSAPGTLNTNNTTAQTASSSEALSGTIKLHKVAKTGTYSDLIGTPTIPTVPTNVSAFTNDANYVSSNNTVTIYSGSSAPGSSTGSNGDIYIQTS